MTGQAREEEEEVSAQVEMVQFPSTWCQHRVK